MGDISTVAQNTRLQVTIDLQPYLLDHHFDGKPVFPAVEAMQLLAATTREYLPRIHPLRICRATFDKFLYLEQISDQTVTGIFNDLEIDDKGQVAARLITKNRLKKAAITRLKQHVSIRFGATGSDNRPIPEFKTATLQQEKPFMVSAEDLYRELVPFGPSYQNVKDDVVLAEDGAVALIRAACTSAPLEPLGSPFPIDAAFHAACAWGQRFYPVVGFPVAFDERIIFKPTRPDVVYIGRIIPVKQQTDPLVLYFDVFVFDENGVIHEALYGLQLKDVSGGRLKPPQWVQK
jgi:hypothetical protein